MDKNGSFFRLTLHLDNFLNPCWRFDMAVQCPMEDDWTRSIGDHLDFYDGFLAAPSFPATARMEAFDWPKVGNSMIAIGQKEKEDECSWGGMVRRPDSQDATRTFGKTKKLNFVVII